MMFRRSRLLNSSWSLLTMQVMLAAMSIGYIAFWPKSGGAASLVSLHGASRPTALAWLAREDALLLEVSQEDGNLTVIVPSQMSVLRAIGAGLIPLSAEQPTCGGEPLR